MSTQQIVLSTGYAAQGNTLGDEDSKIPNGARGLPDQFQGRYAHLVLYNALIPKELFSMRGIKVNAVLDVQFEVYRQSNPDVEQDLLRMAVEQAASGVKRGNFKKIWTAYRTEKFGR